LKVENYNLKSRAVCSILPQGMQSVFAKDTILFMITFPMYSFAFSLLSFAAISFWSGSLFCDVLANQKLKEIHCFF